MAFLDASTGRFIDVEGDDRKLLLESIARRRQDQSRERMGGLEAMLTERLAARDADQAALDRDLEREQFTGTQGLAREELAQQLAIANAANKTQLDAIKEQRLFDETRIRERENQVISEDASLAESLARRMNEQEQLIDRQPMSPQVLTAAVPPEIMLAPGTKEEKALRVKAYREDLSRREKEALKMQLRQRLDPDAEKFLTKDENGRWVPNERYFRLRLVRAGVTQPTVNAGSAAGSMGSLESFLASLRPGAIVPAPGKVVPQTPPFVPQTPPFVPQGPPFVSSVGPMQSAMAAASIPGMAATNPLASLLARMFQPAPQPQLPPEWDLLGVQP